MTEEYWLDKYNFVIVMIMISIFGMFATFLTLDIRYMWYAVIYGLGVMGIMIALKNVGVRK